MSTQELAGGTTVFAPSGRTAQQATTPSATPVLDSAESGDREASAGSLIPGSSSAGSTTFPDPERSPAVRVGDPETCREPSQGRMSAGRLKVLAALCEHGPLTDFEHEAINGLIQQSAGKRRLELQRAGLVERAGTSVSTHGSPAAVWAVTEAGVALHRELRS